jgi:hypothetical protein
VFLVFISTGDATETAKIIAIIGYQNIAVNNSGIFLYRIFYHILPKFNGIKQNFSVYTI